MNRRGRRGRREGEEREERKKEELHLLLSLPTLRERLRRTRPLRLRGLIIPMQLDLILLNIHPLNPL